MLYWSAPATPSTTGTAAPLICQPLRIERHRHQGLPLRIKQVPGGRVAGGYRRLDQVPSLAGLDQLDRNPRAAGISRRKEHRVAAGQELWVLMAGLALRDLGQRLRAASLARHLHEDRKWCGCEDDRALAAPTGPKGVPGIGEVSAAPPLTETFFIFPPAKNPIHWPSGEKNGSMAPSVPGMALVSRLPIARRYSCRALPRMARYAS